MPGGDRTGPLGLGSRTGRAAGYCAGYGMPGYMNPIPGGGFWGFGRGRGGGWGGGGRGWRHWYHATGLTGWQRGWPAPAPYPVAYDSPLLTPEQELSMLKNDLRCLEESAEQLRRRMEELRAKETETTQT